MVDQGHPYAKLAVIMYPKVVNKLLMSGQINQQEASMLMQQMNGPGFSQFVSGIIAQVPALQGESHMERLLIDNYIGNIVNMYRQQQMTMMPPPGVWGGGMYRPTAPWGGFAPSARPGSGWYAGSGADPGYRGFSPSPAQPPRPFQTQQQQKPTPTQTPQPVKKTTDKYSQPSIVSDKSITHTLPNGCAFVKTLFSRDGDVPIVEVYATDSRPRYSSAEEVVNLYKGLVPDKEAKVFLTVCYNELKVIRADRHAVSELMKAISVAVGNINHNDLDKRISAMISVCSEHPSGAVKAFTDMVLDELHEHIYSGELTDSRTGNEKFAVTVYSLSQMRDILTNNLPQDTRTALSAVSGFNEAFRRIVTKVMNTVVVNGAYKKLLDPINDKSIIDVYGNVIPPIWNEPSTDTWESTDSLFMRYLSSIKTIGGTKPESAISAEQNLRSKLLQLDKAFTVYRVPRIITWCNSPSSSVVGWNSDGSCSPVCYTDKNVDNDVAFFLKRAMLRTSKSESSMQKDAPCKVICEVDEGKIKLDYGTTTDEALWVGSTKFLYKR